MGKAIILSENSGHFRRWANQFVNADPDNRGMVLVNPRRIRRNPTASQLIHYVDTYYAAAAQSAGRDGCVIVSLGHGGSHATDRTVGMVDLLPRRALRLQAEQLRYGGSEVEEGDLSVLRRLPDRRTCRRVLGAYDYNPRTRRPQPPEDQFIDYSDCTGARAARPRQQFQTAFARIGQLLRTNRVREVVLLTCRVGGATSFVDSLARSWRVNILAYKRRVAANRDRAQQNPYHVYLVGDERHLYRQELPTRHGYRATARP